MELPVELLIHSSSPILCLSIQRLLGLWPEVCRSRTHEDEAELRSCPDAILIVPQTWEEMVAWLPPLRRKYASCPWLLLVDARLAGMCLPLLEPHPCRLVTLDASPECLKQAVVAVANRRASYLSAELLARFAQGLQMEITGRRVQPPTSRELQCACAVSLGLSNAQIAELLHLGEATVKTHVFNVMRKTGLSRRADLGAFVHRSLSVPASPSGVGARWSPRGSAQAIPSKLPTAGPLVSIQKEEGAYGEQSEWNVNGRPPTRA